VVQAREEGKGRRWRSLLNVRFRSVQARQERRQRWIAAFVLLLLLGMVIAIWQVIAALD
jgi:hypothetical protein